MGNDFNFTLLSPSFAERSLIFAAPVPKDLPARLETLLVSVLGFQPGSANLLSWAVATHEPSAVTSPNTGNLRPKNI